MYKNVSSSACSCKHFSCLEVALFRCCRFYSFRGIVMTVLVDHARNAMRSYAKFGFNSNVVVGTIYVECGMAIEVISFSLMCEA